MYSLQVKNYCIEFKGNSQRWPFYKIICIKIELNLYKFKFWNLALCGPFGWVYLGNRKIQRLSAQSIQRKSTNQS